MYSVKITDLANQELEEIVAYLAVQLGNPAAASRFLDEVASCYQGLKRNPKLYEVCRDTRLSQLGYRKGIVGKYLVIHRVDDTNKTVYILHVFYGKRDYEKLI